MKIKLLNLKKKIKFFKKKKFQFYKIFNKKLYELIFCNQINQFIKSKRYKSNLEAINTT